MKTKLPKLTLPIIRSWKPCYDPAKFAPEKWQGNIIDILRCDKIPADDRLWCALQPGVGIDEKTLRLFACWCASNAIKLLPEKERDPRSLNAISVAERFANGEATLEALSAAREAAWDAAWAAARAAQIEHLITMIS